MSASDRPPNARLHRERTAPRRLVADRIARWMVSVGGVGIIVTILGILVFILAEVWPLLGDARVETARRIEQPAGGELTAAAVDEHRTHLVGLARDGRVRVVRLADGALTETVDPLATARPPSGGAQAAAEASASARPGVTSTAATGEVLSAALDDGRVMALPARFRVRFDGQERRVEPAVGEPALFTLDPEGAALGAWTALLDEGGGPGAGAAAAQLADSSLALVRRTVDEGFLSDEVTETVERSSVPVSYTLSALALDRRTRNLYAGTPGGELLWWRIGPDGPADLQVVSAGGSGITSLALLLGDRSLVVGQEDGSLSVWFPIEPEGRGRGERLTRIRDFPPLATEDAAAITSIQPSPRNKGFLVADRADRLGLFHSTAGERLWRGEAPVAEVRGLAFTPKSDGAVVLGPEEVAVLDVHNPHPEITWKTLFGRVHYEGYDEPDWVWQSSSGTDDFEPKLSLTPLLVGTLKGTFYSLLLAIPLGILGAMYLSQFMHPAYKRYIKPVIEIMASLPSVVLGFLAGLWLAPRLEALMPSIFLMLLILPAVTLAAGGLWSSLPRVFRNRFATGSELFLLALALVGGFWLALALEPAFERLVFGGDFQAWLRATTGLPFDQRNAIVVGIAMGFAVIPIIFAISEDAFSNVPPNLVAGSLALGANRWQTVTRVVLPTASPGIFSAVMVGFGRAVGETMIVLMATGNTPLMSWNPFNGFRTLSANIAVEIPEAPQAGTLYRTLFLAALLLFVLTFLVNTAAEVVRHHLRQRYSKL